MLAERFAFLADRRASAGLEIQRSSAGDSIGHALARPLVLQCDAKAVESGDHRRHGGSHGGLARPAPNEAVALLPGLDDVPFLQSGPVRLAASMCLQEGLILAGLYAETHDVERCHVTSSRCL